MEGFRGVLFTDQYTVQIGHVVYYEQLTMNSHLSKPGFWGEGCGLMLEMRLRLAKTGRAEDAIK